MGELVKKLTILFLISMLYTSPISEKSFLLSEPDYKKERLVSYISSKYRVSKDFAKDVVLEAHRLGGRTFPTPIDILAVVAIESSFNPRAVSTAGAKGLMQILYKKSKQDIKTNLKDGTDLLKDYYKRHKGNLSATIQSYNVGVTAYIVKDRRNHQYYNKFASAKKELEIQ